MPRLAAISGYLFAFLLLSALTWLVWQYRYEALQDQPALTLKHTPADVMRVPFGKMECGADGLRMKAAADIPRLEFRWREQPRAKFAHIRIDASCQGVELGKFRWDDARLTLLWIGADGKLAPDYLPLWAAYGDRARGQRDIVVPLSRHATLPKIVISNRGSAGEFVLHSFSVQPVAWRPGMRPAIILLVFAWFAWAAWGVRRWVAGSGAKPTKVAGAAALWVAFGWYSSLPGPWIPWQSLGKPFPIDVVSAPAAVPKAAPVPKPAPAPASSPPAPTPAPPPNSGTPPVNPAPPAPTPVPAPAPTPEPVPAPPAPQPLPAAEEGDPEGIGGGPIRWLLARLPAVKKIAHLAGFALLTALLGLLTGNRRVIWPALALAGLSEFCQWAFGFGFGWDDVLDLVLDTASVMLGLALWLRFAKWRRRKAPPVESALQSPAANT